MLPAGQSGHPMSPFYFDQNETWRRGQYRRQPFSRGAVLRPRQNTGCLLRSAERLRAFKSSRLEGS